MTDIWAFARLTIKITFSPLKVLQQSRLFVLIFFFLPQLCWRRHKQGNHKLAKTDRHHWELKDWQRTDPLERRFKSESNLHLGMQIHSHLLPRHPTLHLLIAFLHLSLPLIKTLNWLIHTCSCSGSFGTSFHHQSRFSHQLWVHSGAHCPSLTYRAKQ